MPKKLESMIRRGAEEGVKTLRAICADENKKDADRIAAAKVLLDYGLKKENAGQPESLRVVLDDVPEEFLA
jgi:hypothetical protein